MRTLLGSEGILAGPYNKDYSGFKTVLRLRIGCNSGLKLVLQSG